MSERKIVKLRVDMYSDIDGIGNKELMENTHDIGNVIDEDKRMDSEDNINNKELVVKDDRKKDIDVTELSENNDKSTLNKNLLKNDVSTKDKVDLDKEFLFSKDENKKKGNKPKKKDEACDIISIWNDEDDNIEICGFSDKPPAGKLIRTFFTPGV